MSAALSLELARGAAVAALFAHVHAIDDVTERGYLSWGLVSLWEWGVSRGEEMAS